MKTDAYILIEVMVKRALRRIREDPERTTRNLVDMAQHFSKGRFQKHFFEIAQTCLEKENSPYYDVMIDTVQHTDPENILQFGMNLGYNGCTLGAATIRQWEAEKGFNIPWAVFLQLPAAYPKHYMDRYQTIITQGENIGIHVWALFVNGHPNAAMTFAAQHPDSAFVLFCDATDITLTFLDLAGELKNIMVVVRLDENAEAACSLLRAAEMLYSVYYNYAEEDAANILNGSVFQITKKMHPVFTMLLPQFACSKETREAVFRFANELRKKQTFVSLPYDLYGDCVLTDSIISDDGCLAIFNSKGELVSELGEVKARYNLLAMDLEKIFRQAFPKTKGKATE